MAAGTASSALASRSANLTLGNAADAATLEIASGGLTVVCETPLTVAFAGGGFAWTRDGAPLPAAARVRLGAGAILRARAGSWGAFAYLALPGGVEAASVMGSCSTHTRSRLGGLDGRRTIISAARRWTCSAPPPSC
jgi:allophanate hydrolase subunit 2